MRILVSTKFTLYSLSTLIVALPINSEESAYSGRYAAYIALYAAFTELMGKAAYPAQPSLQFV
jgi:hypothetical protein